MSKVASENTRVAWVTSLRCITDDMNKAFLVVSGKRAKQNACKDLFKVGSQKSKAMDRNTLSSKLTNLNRPAKQIRNAKLYNVLKSIYQMFPEISDVPDIDKAT